MRYADYLSKELKVFRFYYQRSFTIYESLQKEKLYLLIVNVNTLIVYANLFTNLNKIIFIKIHLLIRLNDLNFKMYLPPDDTNFFIFGRHIIALCRLNRISNV